MYSFDETEADARETYEAVCDAYTSLFNDLKVEHVKGTCDIWICFATCNRWNENEMNESKCIESFIGTFWFFLI